MRGFSLVELSIVLVILGLLTGGILTGQNLIRAAELRSVIVQMQQFQTAVMSFRDKYSALPGDMSAATDFWGEASDCGGSDDRGVCDGNGDGMIGLGMWTGYTGGEVVEAFQFWRQLARAGLLEGEYSGVVGAAGKVDSVGGWNVPAGKINSSVWGVRYHTTASATTHFILGSREPGNHFSFGKPDGNGWPHGVLLQPEELWGIDKKTDDGLPARGRVLASFWQNCTNAADGADFDAAYLLSSSDKACGLWMRGMF